MLLVHYPVPEFWKRLHVDLLNAACLPPCSLIKNLLVPERNLLTQSHFKKSFDSWKRFTRRFVKCRLLTANVTSKNLMVAEGDLLVDLWNTACQLPRSLFKNLQNTKRDYEWICEVLLACFHVPFSNNLLVPERDMNIELRNAVCFHHVTSS